VDPSSQADGAAIQTADGMLEVAPESHETLQMRVRLAIRPDSSHSRRWAMLPGESGG